MRSFKIILLISLLSGILIVPSCVIDSCTGVDFDAVRFFDVQDLEVFAFPKEGWWERIEPTDTVDFDSLGGLYLDFLVSYTAQNSSWQMGFPLVNRAYACSFIAGFDGSKDEQLESLAITSLDFWDIDHPAGSSLNDILQYKGNYLEEQDLALNDFIQAQTGFLQAEDMRLELLSHPLRAGSYRLKVNMTFTNGEAYEEELSLNVK
ncbi:MAG: hypothetical protein AAFY71_18400 [Bacteroidota bacterium]